MAKSPESKAYNSTPSKAEVKIAWNHIPIPPYAISMVLYKDNFAF
jgi:hypothetical protein